MFSFGENAMYTMDSRGRLTMKAINSDDPYQALNLNRAELGGKMWGVSVKVQ